MAVTMIPIEASLQIMLLVGSDEAGNPVHKTRTYNRVKPASEAQAVFEVGQALAGLQAHTVTDMQRTVKSMFDVE